MDDYFPASMIWRKRNDLVCEIQEHLHTQYWEHKFSAYAFAEALERAVRRLAAEGHPFAEPSRDDDDVHIFVRWQLTNLPPAREAKERACVRGGGSNPHRCGPIARAA
jgi:hypothetical protein